MMAWLGERRLSGWVFLIFLGVHMADTGEWPDGLDIHDGNKQSSINLTFVLGHTTA